MKLYDRKFVCFYPYSLHLIFAFTAFCLLSHLCLIIRYFLLNVLHFWLYSRWGGYVGFIASFWESSGRFLKLRCIYQGLTCNPSICPFHLVSLCCLCLFGRGFFTNLSSIPLLSQPQSSDFMQNLPVVAPGILSWNEKDLKELFISTTRDIISQINAVKGDWADIVR